MPDAPPTNTTSRGRQRRGVSGIAALAGGIALTVWMYPRAIPWPAGLLSFPLFLFAALGMVQALTGT